MNWITSDEDRCLKYAGKRTVSLVDDDDDDNKDLKSVNIVHAATAFSVHFIKKKKRKKKKKSHWCVRHLPLFCSSHILIIE